MSPDYREAHSKYYYANRDKWAEYRRRKMAKYPLYTVWHGMLVRTGIRPGAKPHEVKDYIERGIRVCEDWKVYANFEAWCFANCWKPELQLDRIDNDGNYEPSNCRFVTRSQNQQNKRCTVFVVYNGTRMSLATAYKMANCHLGYRLVLRRVLRDKWPIEKALTVPVGSENERN